MPGRMILVLPMYAFLLFCVLLFGWTLLETHAHLRAYPKTGRRDIGESRAPLHNLPPDEGESLAEAEEASAKLAGFG